MNKSIHRKKTSTFSKSRCFSCFVDKNCEFSQDFVRFHCGEVVELRIKLWRSENQLISCACLWISFSAERRSLVVSLRDWRSFVKNDWLKRTKSCSKKTTDFTKHASLEYFKFENNNLIVQQVNIGNLDFMISILVCKYSIK